MEQDSVLSIPSSHEDHERSHSIKFEPPLYLQRYDFVRSILEKYNCKTYMDIGCAECKMLKYLKNSISSLNLMVGVDVDGSILEGCGSKLGPSWFDSIQPREEPLEVYLLNGDISKPDEYFVEKMKHISTNLDCVSMVEIIEHMYEETLANTVDTVFNKLKPNVVVITTPNSDFNIVFADYEKLTGVVNENPNKFRHWDHKFEWSRKEFEEWCEQSILKKFSDYELVEYTGLGKAPEAYLNSDIGLCSQIALFIKKELGKKELKNTESNEFERHLKSLKESNYKNDPSEKIEIPMYLENSKFNDYKLVVSCRYPFETFEFKTIEARNQALLAEINYLINFLTKPCSLFKGSDNDEKPAVNTEEVNEKLESLLDLDDESVKLAAVDKLFSFSSVKKFKLDENDLIGFMLENGFEFTKSGRFVIYKYVPAESSCQSDEDRNAAFNDNEEDEELWTMNGESAAPINNSIKYEEENWDEEIAASLEQTIENKDEKVYSLEEQFENADDYETEEKKARMFFSPKPFLNPGKEKHLNNESALTLNDSEIASSVDSFSYEVNYFATNAQKLAHKFNSVRRKNTREQRKKSLQEFIKFNNYDSE